LSGGLAVDFLLRWKSLEAVQNEAPVELRKFYREHRCRKIDLIEKRLSDIASAVAVTKDDVIIETSAMIMRSIFCQIQDLNQSITEFDKELSNLCKEHTDSEIFESFRGAGLQRVPRLIAAFGNDKNKFDSILSFQAYSGIAPVVEKSGKQDWTHMRWSCSVFIKQTFHEFAAKTIPFLSLGKSQLSTYAGERNEAPCCN
jgi:transposase